MNDDKLEELMGRAHAMGYNGSAAGLWAEAAQLARELGKLEEEVFCLLNLVTSYHSQNKLPQVLAPFVQVRKIYREHPEVFTEDLLYGFAWAYRHTYGAMSNIPEVPVAQLEEMLEASHEFYKTIGDSRRALFQRDYDFARMVGDTDMAEQAHNNWQNAELTHLSNCPACDPEVEVAYLIDKEEYEKAISLGERSIESGEMTCASQPYSMQALLMGAYLKVGNPDKAWDTHVRTYRYIQTSPARSWLLPAHMRLMAKLAAGGRAGCAKRGLDMFIRHLPWWMESEDPVFLLEIAKASAMVCAVNDPDQVLPITLPGSQLPWQPEQTIENPTVKAAFDWCMFVARGIAKRFDARPGLEGGTAARDLEQAIADVNAVAPDAYVTSASVDDDMVIDVSGLMTEIEATLKQAAEPARAEPARESVAFGFGRYSAALSVDELIELHRQTGHNESGYLELAAEKGLSADRYYTLVAGDSATELARADAALHNDDATLAVQLYRDLLAQDPHSHSDPVFTRIAALVGVARCGQDNAITYLREAINTAAAAGLRGKHVTVALELIDVLKRAGRTSEIAAVAENALMNVDQIKTTPVYSDAIVRLRQEYLEVLTGEDDLYTAAQQAVEISERQQDPEQQANWLSEAAIRYFAAREFDEFHRLLTQALRLVKDVPLGITEAQIRTWYGVCIARQPWQLSAGDIEQIRTIFADGRDRAKTYCQSEEFARFIVADLLVNEASALALAERPDLADEAAAEAINEKLELGLHEEVAMIYVQQAGWNAFDPERAREFLAKGESHAVFNQSMTPELAQLIAEVRHQLG